MHQLFFAIRVLSGMILHGFLNLPRNLGKGKRTVSVVFFPVGLLASYLAIGYGIQPSMPPLSKTILEQAATNGFYLLQAVMTVLVMTLGSAFTLMMFFASPRLSFRKELALAREAQVQRMYPTQHARMEHLSRRTS